MLGLRSGLRSAWRSGSRTSVQALHRSGDSAPSGRIRRSANVPVAPFVGRLSSIDLVQAKLRVNWDN